MTKKLCELEVGDRFCLEDSKVVYRLLSVSLEIAVALAKGSVMRHIELVVGPDYRARLMDGMTVVMKEQE